MWLYLIFLYFLVNIMMVVRRWPDKIDCCFFKLITETIIVIFFGLPILLIELSIYPLNSLIRIFDLRSIYFLIFTKKFNKLRYDQLERINKFNFTKPWLRVKIRKMIISVINKRNNYYAN